MPKTRAKKKLSVGRPSKQSARSPPPGAEAPKMKPHHKTASSIDHWNEMLRRLRAFAQRTGHADVPTNYSTDPELGRWLVAQRKAFRKGSLDRTQIYALEHLPNFFWNRSDAVWTDMLNRLTRYQQRHGNVLVPVNYPEDPVLGRWTHTQRQRYRTGKMGPTQFESLEALGMVWTVQTDRFDEQWRHQFERLQAFHREHGTIATVGHNNDHSLANWVNRQRKLHAQQKIPADRVALLEGLGLVWDVTRPPSDNRDSARKYRELWVADASPSTSIRAISPQGSAATTSPSTDIDAKSAGNKAATASEAAASPMEIKEGATPEVKEDKGSACIIS